MKIAGVIPVRLRKILNLAGCMITLSIPSTAPAQLVSFSQQDLTDYTAQNPFDRLPDGRPRLPDDMIQRARGLSPAEVRAVLAQKGVNNQYADEFPVLPLGRP